MSARLDPAIIPLDAINLIEASAGTGKTYTITNLYLRLLLEKKLSPQGILVVTFTEAATLELKDRIRERLQAAHRFFSAEIGVPRPDDTFLMALSEKYAAEKHDHTEISKRLELALSTMDLASIFTIHGFCLRTLIDSAFESGSLFDLECTGHDTELLRETVDDFWRRESPRWHACLHGYLHMSRITADTLFEEVTAVRKHLFTVGENGLLFPETIEPTAFDASLLDGLRRLWQDERDTIVDLLASPLLSKSRDNYHPANVTAWTSLLDHYVRCSRSPVEPVPVAAILAMARGKIKTAISKAKKGAPPQHAFFDGAETLATHLGMAAAGMRKELLATCTGQLRQKKKQRRILAYDDLLLDLRDALGTPATGEALAKHISRRYPAALIDEFQDTDPVQFEIFKRIYHDHREATILFMIGDPKQAIYSFRGADIFAYIAAARLPGVRVWNLDTNWRSDPGLVKAVNRLFSRDNAFVFDAITFSPVHPAPEPKSITVDTTPFPSPFTFIRVSAQKNRDTARRTVATLAAREVAWLLAASRRGDIAFVHPRNGFRQPLAAGDIAVLVRTHSEGELVRKALGEVGVRTVVHSRASVYATVEARELELLLKAVHAPLNEVLVRSALVTSFFGLTSKDLLRFEKEREPFDAEIEQFLTAQKIWRERGPAVMLHHLFQHRGVYQRVAGYPNGERRITNYRHLIELLQAASHEGLGPEEQLSWFGRMRRGSDPDEEAELRLESDENLVKIVTIHKSKGLEYRVVICPFAWNTTTDAKTLREPLPACCHAQSGGMVIDFGSPQLGEHQARALQEARAEELRLLYVALTRAKSRCLVFWGKVGSDKSPVTNSSALASLLPADEVTAGDVAGKDAAMTPDDAGAEDRFFAPLAVLAGQEEYIGLRDPIKSDDFLSDDLLEKISPLHEPRSFDGSFRSNWSITSFTALGHTGEADPEAPDRDRISPFASQPADSVARDLQEGNPLSFFDFPRGAKAGSCLHEIFEVIDFTDPDEETLHRIVAEKITDYGFHPLWRVTVAQAVRAICNTQIDPGKPGLRLGALDRRRRLDELGFYYSMPKRDNEELLALFDLAGQKGRGEPRGKGTDGTSPGDKGLAFMKGFIDLVFEWEGKYHIVDYKSNHLGSTLEDYSPERIGLEMVRSGYVLQSHIYTLALHRYLKTRLGNNYAYARHFGGIYYLFLRGMDPAAGHRFGVYQALPSEAGVEELDRYLTDGGVSAAVGAGCLVSMAPPTIAIS